MSAFILMMALHIELILCTQYKNGDVSSPFTLYLDDHILSHGGLAKLVMQPDDGNLAMHKSSPGGWSVEGWESGTDPNGDHVELQDDGKLVVFNATEGVLWQSNSNTGTAPFRLIVTDDVETYILDSLDEVVWSTNPSFASFEAIWTEPFNSNGMGWSGGDLIFSSTSPHCPNYPDVCLKLPWANLMGDSRSWADIYDTDISMYNAIQLQVDITGYGLKGDNACEIWWSFDVPSWNDWELYATVYPSGVFKDIIIDISLPSSYTSFGISLSIKGNSNADQCYFDNAILRGILTKSPTQATRTLSPTQTTHAPTKQPSEPTQARTASPTIHATQQTSSSVTDTIDLAGNVIRDGNNSNALPTMLIALVILSFLCFVLIVLFVVWIRALMRKNSNKRVDLDTIVSQSSYNNQIVSEINDVTRGSPASPVSDVLEIYTDEGVSHAVNDNAEGFGTPNNGGLSNIAPDEFVVVGDDEYRGEEAYQRTGKTTQGSCNEDVDYGTEPGHFEGN